MRQVETVALEDARRVIAAGEQKAREIGYPSNVAVVDAGGNLVSHIRMDDAWMGSIDISINKAFTARAFDTSTGDLATNSQPGEQFYGISDSNHGRVMIFAGGLPLRGDNGNVVGGVGVSGGHRRAGPDRRRGCHGRVLTPEPANRPGRAPGVPTTHPPEVLPRRRLDAHHHLWSAARVARGDYPWMPTGGPLRGDHLPEHLAPALEATGVGGTILVQAAPSVEETRFLLELAHANDFVLGVTGWVALDRPEDAELLAELAADEYLRAVRPMIHDLPDPNWITRPQVHANLQRLDELGLRFEALTRTEHLPALHAALEAVPELPTVINHLSKPTYRPDADDQWRQWMLRLAERPNTWCKFSGMLTEVGPGWSPEQFQPYADFLFETFGADRVMFGSDWPVSSQLLPYTDVVALTDQLVTQPGPAEADAFWAHTAERFYDVRAPAAATPTRSDQPLSS